MRIVRLAPFGAEVRDVDLTRTLDLDAARLTELVAASRVVVFRDQTIDDRGFVRFLTRLGAILFTEGETPVEHVPDLNVVSNVGRATPPRSVFHTDTSYVAQPPAFTALRSVRVPERGGATLFSDQVAIANALPHVDRAWLHGRSVVHRGGTSNGRESTRRHPLLRRHPVTDEIALYLSTPERCTHLSGTDERTSARVIAALYARSIRPLSLYRHAWRAGDVVLWDNRVTMHRADHDGVVGDRVLHRGMVRGEVPIGA